MSGPSMPFVPNPDYGKGEARRTISLAKRGPSRVDAYLVDNYHEMRCTIDHDGSVVTSVKGEMIRYPTTACPGAPDALQEVVGLPLDIATTGFYDPARLRRNCTHLFDSALLAMRHARRTEQRRIYEAVVPDAADGPIWIEARCDGHLVHRWRIDGDVIVAPAALAGRPMLKGFGHWSAETFDSDALEAASVLGKTCFIATIRPYSPAASVGQPIVENRLLLGACYAYAPERIEGAVLRAEAAGIHKSVGR
ncbi:DUF2889 domain-containing protein [Rhizorhabdus histidinilytica]|nr:DUF2889 domain-containing protein [Rhizorhabdus histidinilytica]